MFDKSRGSLFCRAFFVKNELLPINYAEQEHCLGLNRQEQVTFATDCIEQCF